MTSGLELNRLLKGQYIQNLDPGGQTKGPSAKNVWSFMCEQRCSQFKWNQMWDNISLSTFWPNVWCHIHEKQRPGWMTQEQDGGICSHFIAF